MSIFKLINNERGFLLLIFVTITAIGGTMLVCSAPLLHQTINDSRDYHERVANGTATNQDRDEQNRRVDLTMRGAMATAGVVNSMTSVSPGGTVKEAIGTGIAVGSDIAIGYGVAHGSNPGTPAPTRSNPLPSGVHPPSNCSSGSLSGCTSRSSCTSAGGYYRNNNTCGTTPAISCTPGHVTDCRSPSACIVASGYWYDSICHIAPEPCTSTRLYACDNGPECSNAGGFWYDGDCNPAPQCDGDHLSNCNSGNCESAGGYWYDDSCNSQPQCNENHLDFCTSTDCSGAGGYWYNDTCNSEPTCDSHHLSLCTSSNCSSVAGGYWYDDKCNQSPAGCYSNDIGLCANSSDCDNAGGYWYNSHCNSEPENNCGSAGVFTCNNGTQICADLVCNSTDNCGDNSDEQDCGDQSSCCVRTNGCASETATSCGDTCCCCPYGQICDRSNPANGCVAR